MGLTRPQRRVISGWVQYTTLHLLSSWLGVEGTWDPDWATSETILKNLQEVLGKGLSIFTEVAD